MDKDREDLYASVFGTEQGQLILEDLIATFQFLDASYEGDANDILIKEGSRAVILHIIALSQADIIKSARNIMKRRSAQ